MNLTTYRHHVLETLRGARGRWPRSGIFLLYVPGEGDPLGLVAQETPRRHTAVVAWGNELGNPPRHCPRVIELDCRRVAAYLLEHDAAFDDPLLEESLTWSYEQLSEDSLRPAADKGRDRAVCGWLVSTDSAHDIARRFLEASQRTDPATSRRHWLRWHDPRMTALLWPTLNAAQRTALLGPRSFWLALDAAGHLVHFDALQDEESQAQPSPLAIGRSQWGRASRVVLVNQLVDMWRERAGRALPRHAAERVHGHVELAERWGLNGRDLLACVFASLALQPGFERDARMLAVVRATLQEPGTFHDHLDALPPGFWDTYARPE